MKTTTESPATKPAKPRLNKAQVLELLSATHPGLPVETDRDWLWVTQKLDQSVPIEAAVIKWLESIGFIYAKRRGGHPMPSGKTGYYGHNCTHYVPFKRHGTAARSSSGASGGIHTSVTTNPPMPTEELDPELAAFLNS